MILLNPNVVKSQRLNTPNNKINMSAKTFKDMRHKFAPFEMYYEKHKDEFSQYTTLFIAKGKAKIAYLNLSDKKKLKFIKKAEKKFDNYKVNSLRLINF